MNSEAAEAETAQVKGFISIKAFLHGLVVVAFLYALIFGFIAIRSHDTIQQLEDKLATKTVDIKHTKESSETVSEEEEEIQEEITHTVPASKKIAVPLSGAPIEGLFDKTKQGLLPRVSEDGRTPFGAYKKPYSLPGKPMISIIVMDFGLSEKMSQTILTTLPSEVSLILSPYAANPDKWQKQARKNGHETWLHMPVENERYPTDDPGPQALLVNSSLTYNQDKMNWALTRATGFAGIAAFTDDSLAESQEMFENLIKGLFTKGLGYFELNPEAKDMVQTIAGENEAPYAKNVFFLQDVSLKRLEGLARSQGRAIGVINPRPNAIKSLKIWTDTLRAKGFALAPVSAIAKPPIITKAIEEVKTVPPPDNPEKESGESHH